MLVGLLKTTLVNFPGRVAAAVFLPGCNLRCPFCHNAELTTASVVSGPRKNSQAENSYVQLEEVYLHLEKRKNVLGGLTISGGEPFLSPALPDLIVQARSLGLAVKIDTNGTLPERLEMILADPALRPDMIAIDIKTSISRYGELTTEQNAGESIGQALSRSLEILAREQAVPRYELPKKRTKLQVEYRTVLVPGLVDEAELQDIAAVLPSDADWELASFVPGTCLCPSWNDIEPYGPEKTKSLLALAKRLIPGVKLR